MRVVLLTSRSRSAVDDHDIGRLLDEVEADYSVVMVTSTPRPSRVARLRRALRRHGPSGVAALALRTVVAGRERAETLRAYREQRERDMEEDLFPGGGRAAAAERLAALPRREVEGVNDSGSEEAIASMRPDLVVQCGAGILRRNIIAIPPRGVLNLHLANVAGIRGSDSIFWALYHGRPDWVGATLHLIDEGIDTGPVIAYRQVPYVPGERVGVVLARAARAGAELLVAAVRAVARGEDLAGRRSPVRGIYRSGPTAEEVARLLATGFLPVEPRDGPAAPAPDGGPSAATPGTRSP